VGEWEQEEEGWGEEWVRVPSAAATAPRPSVPAAGGLERRLVPIHGDVGVCNIYIYIMYVCMNVYYAVCISLMPPRPPTFPHKTPTPTEPPNH
jgi:hypothetical protein